MMNDIIFGDDFDNNLSGGDGDDQLFGYAGYDTLLGGDDNDYLDGGLDADFMDGGDGDDTYIVDHVNDIVREMYDDALGGTADTVLASVSYSIAPGTPGNQGYGIENLTLKGFDHIDATGNSKDNILTGNGGDNTLDGGLGIDTMDGGDGNDTYIVDHVDDIASEMYDDALGGTADTVLASVSYSLAPGTFGNQGYGIENLTLKGFDHIDATGNSKDNILKGNSGDNVLKGKAGDDIVKGKAGNDTIYGNSGDDTLKGGKDNDFLYGDAGYDFLKGGKGDDVLEGGYDNDVLKGGKGDDVLTGVDPSDWDAGEYEYDILTGGKGGDTFVLGDSYESYYIGSGYATITDFDWTEGDTFVAFGYESDYYLEFDYWSGSSGAQDTLIYYHSDLIGVVEDTTDVILSADFTFV